MLVSISIVLIVSQIAPTTYHYSGVLERDPSAVLGTVHEEL